jgi:hypothetical protein
MKTQYNFENIKNFVARYFNNEISINESSDMAYKEMKAIGDRR